MEQLDLSKLKVLVADDEPKLRALVAGCVRTLGCETFEARDGDEAWAIAQSRRVDVVVLDVMMPGMSGWEVCRRIKASAKTARGAAPKVLMLTGIGEHLNEMTSPLFAADAWIDKPFDLDALRERVVELAEAGWREAPPAPPSGPSLKKARPGPAPFEQEEQDSALEAAPPTPAVLARDAAPRKPSSKKKKKQKKKARATPAKRAKPKPVAKKKAPKKKASKKKAPTKKASKKRAAKKVPKKAPKKAQKKAKKKARPAPRRKKRPAHVKPRKKAPRRGRR